MPTQHEFFQVILNSPEDIALRLVYADWCDERGDPRGEFIRVQCALASDSLSTEERQSLEVREAELLAEHRREWNGEIHRRLSQTPLCHQVDSRRGAIRGWEYQRGFVEVVVLEAEAFVEFPQAVFQIGPLRKVRILHGQGRLPEVLNSPFQRRLKQLELAMPEVAQQEAEQLIAFHQSNRTEETEISTVQCQPNRQPPDARNPPRAFHQPPTWSWKNELLDYAVAVLLIALVFGFVLLINFLEN